MASEFLATNILEDGFMKSFAPILFCQKLFFSGRTNFEYHFASGPSKRQRILTVIGLIIINCLYNYSRVTYVMNYEHVIVNDKLLFALNQASTSVYMFAMVASVTQARFFDHNKASDFYMKLQEIGNIMKMRRSKARLYTMAYHRSIATVCSLCVFVFTFMYPSQWYNYNLSIMMACVCWATGAFLMELTLCLQTGVDLIAKLKYLNGILKSECAALVSPRGGRGGWWYPRDALVQRWVLEDKRALSDSDVTLYLKEIFKGYKMFGDVFKFQVFLLYTVTLMWALMTIEIIIVGIDRLPVYYLASISAGMVVNFCFVCAIGLLGGKFAKEVKNTKYTSTKILMLYSEGPTRKKVKTLIRMIEHNTPVFSIYGIWTADYDIIVRLFSVTTTSLVVLLQLSY